MLAMESGDDALDSSLLASLVLRVARVPPQQKTRKKKGPQVIYPSSDDLDFDFVL